MNRREAIQHVALLLGGAVSAPVLHTVLSGYQPKTPWAPRALNAEQDKIVTIIADMIIPATDTPGAQAVQVNQFMDLLLAEWFKPEDRDRFMAGFSELDARCRKLCNKRFLEASPEERAELLTKLDAEAIEARLADAKDTPFFGMLKGMTLAGYYTSEVGMTQELHYDPTPGYFDGCIPFSQIGRPWA
ncbi:MAG: gluconate 2-dehydrogenase subunit 3 family protein [bacterium]